MMAMIGFWAQAVSTGESPAVNLAAHLADPCVLPSIALPVFFFYLLIGFCLAE